MPVWALSSEKCVVKQKSFNIDIELHEGSAANLWNTYSLYLFFLGLSSIVIRLGSSRQLYSFIYSSNIIL